MKRTENRLYGSFELKMTVIGRLNGISVRSACYFIGFVNITESQSTLRAEASGSIRQVPIKELLK
ncbi:hypothetical protein D3C75_1141170 [compost metagenome]